MKPLSLWDKTQVRTHYTLKRRFIKYIKVFYKIQAMQSEYEATPKLVQIFHQIKPQNFDFQFFTKINLTHPEWSDEMMNEDIDICNRIIQDAVKKAANQVDLLKRLIPLIIDCLFLKGRIFYVYNKLKIYCQEIRNEDLFEDSLENMTFSDFILFLLRMIEKKDTIGLLLSTIRVPLPIYFNLQEKPYQMIQAIKGIMSIDRLSLILNMGSEKARKCGKTTFLFELLSLPTNYMYGQTPFYEDSVFVHTLFPGSKNNLLVDFNGSIEKMPAQVQIFHKNCGLLIFHIIQSQFTGEQYFKENIKFFAPAEKVVLIIRNCQRLEPFRKLVTDSLSKLDQEMQNKIFVYPLKKKIDKKIESTTYIQIGQKIFAKNNLFQLKKTFNFFDISSNQHKISNVETYYQNAKKVIAILDRSKSLKNDGDLTQQLFPHLFKSNEICELIRSQIEKSIEFQYVTQENRKVSLDALEDIKNRRILLEKELKQGLKISEFVQKGFDILKKGIFKHEQVEVFAAMLYIWKKEMISPLMSQYIDKTKDIRSLSEHESEKRKILVEKTEKIKQRLEMYDISLTTVLNEVITQLSYQQASKELQAEGAIDDFYSHAYKSMTPINLIDGKNLMFGNKYLKEFCSRLSNSQKFKNKKVYIVSVIGAQSSGKSTLLNYLFRCQFETSAGRCTKGMYFNICEYEDKIIWVIDTEGLLSLTARDQVFDNKIATFVLSISDVVIINNKGELTAQLRDMLKICTFAMKYLKKEDSTGKSKPQKLVFALQNQLMQSKKEKFQQQIVANIITELEKQNKVLGINYKQYLCIEPEDIFCFPSAFNEEKITVESLGTIKSCSEVYGRCVLGLRSRIMGILDKQSGRESISDCYTQAESCWKVILRCGSNLMNYKTHEELNSKQSIFLYYLELLPDFQKRLSAKYESLFKKQTEGRESKLLQQKKKQIKNLLINLKQDLYVEFRKELRVKCAPVCNTDDWFADCNKRILAICQSYESYYINRLEKHTVTLSQQEQQQEFTKSIQAQINELLQKNTSKENMLKCLQKRQKAVNEQFKKNMKNFKQSALSNEKNIQIFFQRGFKDQKVSTSGSFWVLDYKKYLDANNYSDMYKVGYFTKLKDQDEKDMQKYLGLLLTQVEQMAKSRNEIINLKDLKELENISLLLDDALKKIHGAISEQFNQIRLNKSGTVTLLGYDKVKMRDLLRGCLISVICEIYSSKQKAEIEQKREKCLKSIQQYERNIVKAFENKDSIDRISSSWIEQAQNYYINLLEANCFANLQNKLQTLKLSYRNPEFILEQAFRNSFLCQTPGKMKWISCFKMMADTNKYLFQILCSQPIIQMRRDKIGLAEKEERANMKQKIETEFKDKLNRLQTDGQVFKQFQDRFKLLHTPNFRPKDILKLMSSHIKDQVFFNNFMEEIEESIDERKLVKRAEAFIENDLKTAIIGCQARCPYCGTKCKKFSGHQGGHQVKFSCHVMACFGGLYWQTIQTPCFFFCGTSYHLQQLRFKSTKIQNDKPVYMPTMEYLKTYIPSWHDHFKEILDKKIFQTTLEETRYQQIWANVKDMLIKHKYTAMKDEGKFNELKNDPLTDEDLEQSCFVNLRGEHVTLMDYALGK